MTNNYVYFGSPLDPLEEEDLIRTKPIRIEDQIATDENGRRRFHGAFTGGFSAGFFNTPGSRDGWTPNSFKSSKNSTSKAIFPQKPEDFMDTEDMGEFGFAPKGLQASRTFENKNKKHSDKNLDVIPGIPVFLDSVLRPTSTIGVTLLRHMGWKPGQGLGPKIKRRVYLEKYKDFLFAPDDVPNFIVNPKANTFGIAYKGLKKHINLFDTSESSSFKMITDKQKRVNIRGQAFGVGVYEEEDEDVYGSDNMSRYDFALSVDSSTLNEQDDENKDSFPPLKRIKNSRWSGSPNKDSSSSISIIEGFVRGKIKANSLTTKFPLPNVPKDFIHKIAKKSRFSENESTRVSKTHLKPIDRERLLSINSETAVKKIEEIRNLLSNKKPDKEAFKPFSSEPEKQKRYEQYLVCITNNRFDALPILQSQNLNMTQWEKERERDEFERAATLFTTSSTFMASRFVSSGKSTDEPVPESNECRKAASLKYFGKLTREKVTWTPARLLCLRFNVKNPGNEEQSSNSNSKFDLFNNIPMTEESSSLELSSTTFDTTRNHEKKDGQENGMKGNDESHNGNERDDKDGINEEYIENERISPKPSMDLFKAIFLDESSDEEETEIPTQTPTPTPNQLPEVPEVPTGLFANIDFEMLNSQKCSKVLKSKEEPSLSSFRSQASDFFEKKEQESIVFGPSKPAVLKPSNFIETPNDNEEEDSDCWVENSSFSLQKSNISSKKSSSSRSKKSSKKSSSSRSKKSSKKSYSKKSGKKKKKKRKKSSDSSSSCSSES